MKTIKKIIRFVLKVLKWGFMLLIILAIISALNNLTLPSESEVTENLTQDQKVYISEAVNLLQKLSNEVWPGWEETQIPIIVYNEKYAFIIGYDKPPAGWIKMPQEEHRGSEWEVVTTDDFFGTPYYRQLLTNPDLTPENFTAKVGESWVVTMQTKEYAAVAFYKGFRNELPPVLKATFPYQVFWNVLMGKVDNYISCMIHEAFHAFQGTEAPERLADAERVSNLSADYPWNEAANIDGWTEESNLLIEAFNTESNEKAMQLLEQFLNKRKERRERINMPFEIIQYEQKREWLEGLAKYAELIVGVVAFRSQNYKPVNEIETDPGFKNYKSALSYFNQQIVEVKRAAKRPSENRFYYSGMLQAVLLDRFSPGWKKGAFKEGVFLENLLEKSVNKFQNN
jgi:hypothetical protein